MSVLESQVFSIAAGFFLVLSDWCQAN